MKSYTVDKSCLLLHQTYISFHITWKDWCNSLRIWTWDGNLGLPEGSLSETCQLQLKTSTLRSFADLGGRVLEVEVHCVGCIYYLDIQYLHYFSAPFCTNTYNSDVRLLGNCIETRQPLYRNDTYISTSSQLTPLVSHVLIGSIQNLHKH